MNPQFLAGMRPRRLVDVGDDGARARRRTRPGAIDVTAFMSARLSTTPPDSGMAWP